MPKIRLKLLSAFFLALMAIASVPPQATADDADPPGRVARLAYTEGSISFQPAGTDDWVSAVVNRPMSTGDKLWTDQDSRAELHIGSASIRLSSNTGFSFLNLTDDVTQLSLTAGTLRIRVKRLGENETFEVDTPNLAFSILRPGTYRIRVNDEGDATMIAVRGGEGEVTGGGGAYALHARSVGTFSGTDQLNPEIDNLDGHDEDDFDRWCRSRDRREDESPSARYVAPDVIGYEDLDQYGQWRSVPEYGYVWIPQSPVPGWVPYQYGHWAYVAPWGYTWVDDAPWGFAPFHYGRWVAVDGRWAWVPAPPPTPGVVYVRPVYAPALVAWVGGAHFAVGVSVGGGASVGWFPLGPREVYVPSYPVSRTYVNNVNVTNTTVNTTVVNNYYNTVVVNKTVVNQTYVNQRVPGAVTATTQQAFTSAQPVSRNIVHVDQRAVATAQVSVATPAIAPPKQAVLGSGRPVAAQPPAFAQNRNIVAKVAPPPPPVSFARQQQAIQANGGRPLAVTQMRQMQPQNAAGGNRPNVRIAPQVNSQVQPNSNSPNRGNVAAPNPRTNAGQSAPAANPNAFGNRPGNPGNQADEGSRRFNDRPPSARPSGAGTTSQNATPAGNNNRPDGHPQQPGQPSVDRPQQRPQFDQRAPQSDQRQQQLERNPGQPGQPATGRPQQRPQFDQRQPQPEQRQQQPERNQAQPGQPQADHPQSRPQSDQRPTPPVQRQQQFEQRPPQGQPVPPRNAGQPQAQPQPQARQPEQKPQQQKKNEKPSKEKEEDRHNR
jgi:hypothetical protein